MYCVYVTLRYVTLLIDIREFELSHREVEKLIQLNDSAKEPGNRTYLHAVIAHNTVV